MMLASRVMAPFSATRVPVTLTAWATVALARERMLAWMWEVAPRVVELPTYEQMDRYPRGRRGFSVTASPV